MAAWGILISNGTVLYLDWQVHKSTTCAQMQDLNEVGGLSLPSYVVYSSARCYHWGKLVKGVLDLFVNDSTVISKWKCFKRWKGGYKQCLMWEMFAFFFSIFSLKVEGNARGLLPDGTSCIYVFTYLFLNYKSKIIHVTNVIIYMMKYRL